MKSWPCCCNRAVTLVEALVTTTIIAILCAVVLPAIKGTQNRALRTKCAGNLKQVATAYLLYITDNDGRLPTFLSSPGVDGWYNPHNIDCGQSLYLGAPANGLHAKVEVSPLAFNDPAFSARYRDSTQKQYFRTTSYWPNANLWANSSRLSNLVLNGGSQNPLNPSRAIMLGVVNHDLLIKNGSGYNANIYLWAWTPARFEYYGGNQTVTAFFDGHLEFLSQDDLQKRWNGRDF